MLYPLKDIARQFIYIFRKTGYTYDLDRIKLVYFTYVQSLLERGLISWGDLIKTEEAALKKNIACIMMAIY